MTIVSTFTGATPLYTGFLNGDGQIWLGDVDCVGTETNLIDCPANAIGLPTRCDHDEDAGVRCCNEPIPP